MSYLRLNFRLNCNVARFETKTRLIPLICSFLSALLAFSLLNRDESWARKRAQSHSLISSLEVSGLARRHAIPHLAGKTIDFTLFTSTRAISVLVLTLWTHNASSLRHPTHANPGIAKLITCLVDPAIFSTSAALIMHAWFYSPDRLPRTYNHWIHRAANVDSRFLVALRNARTGDWRYGETNEPQNQLLRGVAKDLGLPEEWGDPAITIPVKCELIHSGCGPSCEIHALWRFWQAWLLGMEMYFPLQLVLRIVRRPTLTSLLRSVANAARSSAFLGAFISLFYYGVCLSRTRLGPVLFPSDRKSWSWISISPQMWDSGLCILGGCMLCGWSILVEAPGRRGEVAFFVAPRALATLLPRAYDRRYIWREGMVFAAGVAVVLDAVLEGKAGRVRGVLGKVLSGVVVDETKLGVRLQLRS